MKKSDGGFLFFAAMAVLAFGFSAAYAEEQYRVEIAPEYLRQDFDGDSSRTFAGINGEVFFAPVNTERHPYAEAAFLERIGSIFFSAARAEETGGGVDADGMLYAAGVNVAKPGFPLAIRADYAAFNEDIDRPATGEFKVSQFNLRIGDYIMPALLAGVEYSFAKTELSGQGFTGFPTKTNDYGLFAKYLHELSGDTWLGFEGAVGMSRLNDGTETLTNIRESLTVDYFFNRGLSAGVGIENNSGKDESEEGMTYTANFHVYITPKLSVRFEYDRFLNSNAGETNNRTTDLLIAARF